MKKFTLPVLLGLMSMAGITLAHTMAEATKTCPVCNHTFTCMLDGSGTSFGMRLDLKPLGPTPAPWRVPVCTQCSFVIYNDEIPAEELNLCRKIIEAEQYKKHSGRASYFLMGLLFEGLGKEPDNIAHTFLKASWQEEKDQALLMEDLKRSLKHFEVYLGKKPSEGDDGYSTAQLLKGELLRRLGRFDEASEYLKELKGGSDFQDGFLKDIVMYEIRLCDQKDSSPHDVAEAEL